jgi:hypothetical protein
MDEVHRPAPAIEFSARASCSDKAASVSWWKISEYVKKLRNVSTSEKSVLFVLAEFYNRQDKIAWPDQETLARDASISERTLIRVLQVLETPRRNHPKGI